jgi:hypothetical protein
MAIQCKDVLVLYNFLDKIITYVKDEGANLNTLTMTLINIISCAPLFLPQPYVISCYGHAMSKCC